jgi:hypothetical protein
MEDKNMASKIVDEFTYSSERLLKLEEVAILIGSSGKSINNWYWFKRENPDHKLAKLLPDFIQDGERQTRKWRRSDIWKLVEFKSKIPTGRNGVMGSVTQRYYHKKAKKKENVNESEGS